jgi:hypothetical protein
MQNFESIFIILKLFANVLLSPTELTGFTLVPLDHNMKDGRKIEIRYTLFQPYDGRKKTIFLMEDPFDKYFLDGINLYGLENEFNLVQIKGRHNSDAILKILNSTGKTDWTKAYQLLNMDQHARDMELVRKELVGDQQINLLGFSGSAAYLHYYLSLYPEKVYSLISFNPLLFDLQKNLKLQDPANCMEDISLQNRLIAYLWYTFSGSFCPSTNASDRNDFQSYLFLKWGFILPALYSDKEEDAAMKVRLFEHSYGLLEIGRAHV